jgi:ketosteroid isomerase-like protein
MLSPTKFLSVLATVSPVLVPSVHAQYPDRQRITQVFQHLDDGNFTAFLEQVSPTVDWTLMGSHTLAGEYHNRTIFAIDALQRLSNTLDPAKPTSLKLTQITGGGTEEWSVQELHAQGVCKNGV